MRRPATWRHMVFMMSHRLVAGILRPCRSINASVSNDSACCLTCCKSREKKTIDIFVF